MALIRKWLIFSHIFLLSMFISLSEKRGNNTEASKVTFTGYVYILHNILYLTRILHNSGKFSKKYPIRLSKHF